MVTKEVLAYIDTQFKNGFSIAEIREALLAGGWTREDSEAAIATVRPATGGAIDFMPGMNTNASREHRPFASANYQPQGITYTPPPKEQHPAASLRQQPQKLAIPFSASADQNPTGAGIRSSIDSGHTVQLHSSATWSPSILSGRDDTGRRGGKWIVALLLFAFLAGYGGFACYRYFKKIPPAAAVSVALKNLLNASSFRYNADLMITTGGDAAWLIPFVGSEATAGIVVALTPPFPIGDSALSNDSLKLHAEGGYDRHNAAHPVGSAIVRATVNSGTFGDFSLGGEMRLTQSAAYAQLTEVPPIGIDLSGIKNQWISVDIARVRDAITGTTEHRSLAPANALTVGFTAPEIVRLRDTVGSASFLTNVTELADEKIDGVATAHYSFDVSPSGITRFFKELVTIGKDRQRGQGIVLPGNENIDGIADEAIRAFKKIRGEIWISQSDMLPRRLLTHLSFADEKNPAIKGAIEFSVKYSDFSKVHEVALPTGARPLAEVLGGIVAQAQKKSRDAHRIADLAQIKLGLEQYATSQKTPLYPFSLSLLTPRFLPVLPTDPASTTVPYNYSPRPDRKNYHLGASLELLGSTVFGTDADFNSKAAGWKNGFDGADFKKCSDRDTGITCFDLKP